MLRVCAVCSLQAIGSAKFLHYADSSHKKANDLLVVALSCKVLALLVVLTLSLGALVLSSGEAQAEQKSAEVPRPTVATDETPPVQVPAPAAALPKTTPPPVSSTVLVAETQLGPLTAKPSTTPTAGGTAVVNDSTPPPPMLPKKAMEDLARPIERQQEVAQTLATTATRVDPKNRQRASRSPSEPVTGGPLSELSTHLEEKENDALSSPPLKQGKPSVLSPATTFDASEAQAQRLPRAQAALESAPAHSKPADSARGSLPAAPLAALEPPSTDTPSTDTLPATPLPHRASSPAAKPAANNNATAAAAVPIDHPALSPASASTQWEIAPVTEELARELPTTHPRPSSSIGTAMGSVVELVQSSVAHARQEEALVLDLSHSQDSSYAGREISSEGTPPPPAPHGSSPSSPSPEPSDYNSFALSGGGSELSTSVGPLLLGILALGGWFLLRPVFRTYLAWCKIAKPSSALLMPLERPG